MAFRMSENSLFAMLLRSPWWYSALFGVVIIAISIALFGGQFVILGLFASLPFLGIAGYTGYKQAQLPSQKRIEEVHTQAQKMTAIQIAKEISASYEDIRFDSDPFKGNAAELELTRGNRKILLCTKRFKVGNTGIEPLKQLVAAGEKIEATAYLYVALGDISSAAQDYAKKNDIELIQAARLAAFFDRKANVE